MVEAGPGGRDHRERRKVGREERVKMVDRNGAVGRARTYTGGMLATRISTRGRFVRKPLMKDARLSLSLFLSV